MAVVVCILDEEGVTWYPELVMESDENPIYIAVIKPQYWKYFSDPSNLSDRTNIYHYPAWYERTRGDGVRVYRLKRL